MSYGLTLLFLHDVWMSTFRVKIIYYQRKRKKEGWEEMAAVRSPGDCRLYHRAVYQIFPKKIVSLAPVWYVLP